MRYSPDDAQICISERSGRLHIWWTGSAFPEVRASFRATFPRHGEAVWLPDDRCWSMPAWLRPRLELWLARMFEPEAVEWERDDTQARSSRYQRPEGRTPATLDGAYALLHLRPTAPPEVVHAVHRALSKLHHPDAGGDTEAMAAINRAVEIIRDHAQEGAA